MARSDRATQTDSGVQTPAASLMTAVLAELDEFGESGLRIESVAKRAGVSAGVVHHHFGNKDGLIDAARLHQFTIHANADTAALRETLASVTTHSELMRALPGLLASFHSPQRRPTRSRRLANLAATLTRPDYAEMVAQVQHRVTRELASIVDGLKQRGAVDHSTDSLAVATFIQAYTVGQVVADVDHRPVPNERWRRAVLAALRAILPAPANASATDAATERSGHAPVHGHHANAKGQATARAMLEAARQQLETRTEQDFRVDEVLSEVGVSPSSLYHHFGNREGLMEATWIDWAQRNADEDVLAIERALERATTPAEAVEGVRRVVRAAQAPERTERRVQRLMVMSAAARRPAVRAEIGRIESRTNTRYREILERARDRGLLRNTADLAVVPVFVRAFTFGRVTNELSAEPLDNGAWTQLVEDVLVRLLGGDPAG